MKRAFNPHHTKVPVSYVSIKLEKLLVQLLKNTRYLHFTFKDSYKHGQGSWHLKLKKKIHEKSKLELS